MVKTYSTLTNAETGVAFPITVHYSAENLAGRRVRLLEMPIDPDPLPPGSEGTVEWVTRLQGWDQIAVKWDNGRTLLLCVPPDRFEVVQQE